MNREQSENDLVGRLREMVRTGKYPPGENAHYSIGVAAPVSEEEMREAEEILGFKLPSLLRRLYVEVGDGGFGPGYGLLRLRVWDDMHDSLVQDYVGMRSMTRKDIDEMYADREVQLALWPVCAVTICDWGCNIYSIVDCSQPELPVWRMDSNVSFMVQWALEAPSLLEWWETWMDEKPLFHVDWEKAVKVAVADIGKERSQS